MAKLNKKRTIYFLAVIGLLIFLYILGWLAPAEGVITRVLNPVLSSAHSLGLDIRGFYKNQTHQIDFEAEAKSLREEAARLAAQNAKLATVEEENRILREYLGFLARNNYEYRLASVLSRGSINDFSDSTETIIIDKGSGDGIMPGLAVVSSEGVMIGKVAEAKEGIAQVYLTNNKKCKLAATIMNQDRTSGITEGDMGLTIKMNFIPQSTNIPAGDLVITSGLEEYIPRGLAIGRVADTLKESNDLWQSAAIEPMIDPDELIIVAVVLPAI